MLLHYDAASCKLGFQTKKLQKRRHRDDLMRVGSPELGNDATAFRYDDCPLRSLSRTIDNERTIDHENKQTETNV